MKLTAATLFSVLTYTTYAGEPVVTECTKENKLICKSLFRSGLKWANKKGPEFVTELTGGVACDFLTWKHGNKRFKNFPKNYYKTDDNEYVFNGFNVACLNGENNDYDDESKSFDDSNLVYPNFNEFTVNIKSGWKDVKPNKWFQVNDAYFGIADFGPVEDYEGSGADA